MSDEEIEIIRSEEEFQRQNKLILSLQTENTRLYQVEKQLRKEIQQLHQKLKSIEMDNATSSYENKNWRAQLESNLKKSEAQNIQYELDLKSINKKQEKDKLEIQNLKQQLQESQNTIEKDQQIENLQKEIQGLNQKINELNQDHKQQTDRLSNKLKTAKSQLKQEQQNSVSLQDKVKELQDDIVNLKDINQQMVTQIETLNSEKTQMINQNDEMHTKLNQALIENQNLQNQFGFSQSQHQETQVYLQKMVAESQQQQEEKRQAFQRQQEQLNKQNQEMSIQLEEIKQERAHLLKLVSELNGLKSSLAQKEVQIKDTIDKLHVSEAERIKVGKELQDTIQNHQTINSKKDAEIISLKTKIQHFDTKREEYQKIKIQLGETIQNLFLQLDNSHINIKNLHDQVNRLQDELSIQQIEKEAFLKQIEDLKQQYESIQQVNIDQQRILEQGYNQNKEIIEKQKKKVSKYNQLQEQQQQLDQILKQGLPETLGFIIELIDAKIQEIYTQEDQNQVDQKQDFKIKQESIMEHIAQFFIRMKEVLEKVQIKFIHNIK
ncbi:unnamed protein product [Paramecium octaurelia]|uniref:Uncharacterized protein n=1 Tax=Paramecium octaurelia TaxID=43137 RepID=A0A8S1XL94_PAROT|nr:unnamed protein product [Paramecium octaurelia]